MRGSPAIQTLSFPNQDPSSRTKFEAVNDALGEIEKQREERAREEREERERLKSKPLS